MVGTSIVSLFYDMFSLSPKKILYIDNLPALHNMIEILSTEQYLCVDTEFHAENRYLPKLMLLQIADLKQNTWIVDPLQFDITPIADLLNNANLILHGATEDLRILNQQYGIHPKSIFDTQIAASMMGSYYPTRLSNLIAEYLDIHLSQTQTLTDWSERPLSKEQIEYAAEDVSALSPLFSFFTQALSDKKELLAQICAEFQTEALSQSSQLSQDWLQWGVSKTLSPTTINVLFRLLEWREKQAQKQNKPIQYILPKNIALDIARRQPTSITALKQNRKIHATLIKQHGVALLKCIQQGQQDPHYHTPYSTEELRMGQMIHVWAHAMRSKVIIDAQLLMPYELALRIAREGASSVQGWRKAILQKPLEAFLTGQSQLVVQDNQPLIRL